MDIEEFANELCIPSLLKLLESLRDPECASAYLVIGTVTTTEGRVLDITLRLSDPTDEEEEDDGDFFEPAPALSPHVTLSMPKKGKNTKGTCAG